MLSMSGASFSKEALDLEISFIQVLLGEENHWHEECQNQQGKCVDSIDFVSIRHWRVQITLTCRITSFSAFFRTTLFSCCWASSTQRNLYSLSPRSSIMTSSDSFNPTSFSTRFPLAIEMVLGFLAASDRPISSIIWCLNASLIPCCLSELEYSLSSSIKRPWEMFMFKGLVSLYPGKVLNFHDMRLTHIIKSNGQRVAPW